VSTPKAIDGLKKIGGNNFELMSIELITMVDKSLNEIAPPSVRSLFSRNSQSISYRLRNKSRDLSRDYQRMVQKNNNIFSRCTAVTITI